MDTKRRKHLPVSNPETHVVKNPLNIMKNPKNNPLSSIFPLCFRSFYLNVNMKIDEIL